ncbi:MAG: alpha/beta fold hydrolase [Actinobacteria bacterium]|nr:alpha/beta fold hydrolase [Actinomycetota bacterium]
MPVRRSPRRSARPRRRTVRLVAALLGALTIAGFGANPAEASSYPVVYSVLAGFSGALAPNSPPPGANNWSCRSAAHPVPVVLVHATFANQADNWATLSPLLANNGYCVFTFNYGGPAFLGTVYGLGDIPTSARQLGTFIDQVRGATGAPEVDLVGHSQGGMMPRYYLNFMGGASKVRNLVALAPSNHGTTLSGLVTLARMVPGLLNATNATLQSICLACVQQEVGSSFMNKMNSVPDTVPGVNYTVIATRYDEVVTPYQSQFLSGPNVRNIVVQDKCALDFDGHLGMAFDHIALREVLNALDPATARGTTCTFVPFDLGG